MTTTQDKRESETAPLPFSLSALQIEAAKRFGLSGQQVLDTCQRLYETHKLITYPRSDCRYLPEEHFAGRQAVLAAIAGHQPELMTQGQLNTDQRNRCWNDKKVDAHHAIIPTARASRGTLNDSEQKIYGLVARQYLMQFCADAVFRRCTGRRGDTLLCERGEVVARETQPPRPFVHRRQSVVGDDRDCPFCTG